MTLRPMYVYHYNWFQEALTSGLDSASLLLSHYSRESETLPTKIQEQERTLKNPNVTLFALTNQVNKNPNNANLENVCSLCRFVVSFAIRRSVIVLGAFSFMGATLAERSEASRSRFSLSTFPLASILCSVLGPPCKAGRRQAGVTESGPCRPMSIRMM